MNENYQYTEYNEEKNRVPWLRILVSFLILVAAIIIVLLLLKACQKTSLRDDLIEAAKEYYEKYPDRLPSTVAECFVVTLEQLENEGLIKSSDYDICDKKTTYVNVCYLESRTYHYSAILECEAEDTNYGMWQDGTESDIDENSDIRFEFLGEEMNSGTKYYYYVTIKGEQKRLKNKKQVFEYLENNNIFLPKSTRFKLGTININSYTKIVKEEINKG